MKSTPYYRLPHPWSVWLASSVLLAGVLLAGCAGPGGAAGTAAQEDIVTESDITPQQQRARLRLELASDYFQQGNPMVALDEVKKALVANPDYPDALSLRGLIYMSLNDYDIAGKSFARALELKPNDSDILHNMGWLQCQMGNLPVAMDYFERALLNPLYEARPKTYLAQGVCQAQANQLPQAQASLMQAYTLNPSNPVVIYNLAEVLFRRQDYMRARFYINQINKGPLASAETLWLGIKVERKLGDDRAMNLLAMRLNQLFPDSQQAIFYQRGAFDE